MAKKSQKITVPLSDDLAVYARSVVAFLSRRSVSHYAIVVLAQRVILERVKSQRKALRRAEIFQAIERINTDLNYRLEVAARLSGSPDCALAQQHPEYIRAGLLADL